jgi:hypothetical protein
VSAASRIVSTLFPRQTICGGTIHQTISYRIINGLGVFLMFKTGIETSLDAAA